MIEYCLSLITEMIAFVKNVLMNVNG